MDSPFFLARRIKTCSWDLQSDGDEELLRQVLSGVTKTATHRPKHKAQPQSLKQGQMLSQVTGARVIEITLGLCRCQLLTHPLQPPTYLLFLLSHSIFLHF